MSETLTFLTLYCDSLGAGEYTVCSFSYYNLSPVEMIFESWARFTAVVVNTLMKTADFAYSAYGCVFFLNAVGQTRCDKTSNVRQMQSDGSRLWLVELRQFLTALIHLCGVTVRTQTSCQRFGEKRPLCPAYEIIIMLFRRHGENNAAVIKYFTYKGS